MYAVIITIINVTTKASITAIINTSKLEAVPVTGPGFSVPSTGVWLSEPLQSSIYPMRFQRQELRVLVRLDMHTIDTSVWIRDRDFLDDCANETSVCTHSSVVTPASLFDAIIEQAFIYMHFRK